MSKVSSIRMVDGRSLQRGALINVALKGICESWSVAHSTVSTAKTGDVIVGKKGEYVSQ